MTSSWSIFIQQTGQFVLLRSNKMESRVESWLTFANSLHDGAGMQLASSDGNPVLNHSFQHSWHGHSDMFKTSSNRYVFLAAFNLTCGGHKKQNQWQAYY